MTAGTDNTLKAWRYRGAPPPAPVGSGIGGGGGNNNGVTARAVATFHLGLNDDPQGEGDAITGMVGCRRNGRPIPQVVVSAASGTLLIVSLESSHYFAAAAMAEGSGGGAVPSPAPPQQGGLAMSQDDLHARTCWELRPFDAPITAVAMSPRGDCCVAACASKGLIAFFRMVAGVSEASMQLLGFYSVKDPRLLAFAPASAMAGE